MMLTIWRHGEAGRAESDRLRELTDQGYDDIGFGARQFHEALETRALPAPDEILFSPWIRTAQTAQVLAGAFTHAHTTELSALRPGATVQAVEAALVATEDKVTVPRHVVLVTHQPLVSELVDHFLGAGNSVPPLTPGGFATLELDLPAPACATLVFWAVAPEYETGL
jgi:phosphohistidine phosphatase